MTKLDCFTIAGSYGDMTVHARTGEVLAYHVEPEAYEPGDPDAPGVAAMLERVIAAMPQYLQAFPDFDPATLPAIPADWQDISWRQDCCPRFDAGAGISVFVDYLNPAEREFPDTNRFCVSVDDTGDSFASDDWAAVLAYVAEVKARRKP